MNITEMFIAINITLGSGTPVQLEDVYSGRESDGQRYYYAEADETHGRDKKNPELIDANNYRVNFEVSVTQEEVPIEIAQVEISELQQQHGDTYQLVSQYLSGKTATQALELYSSSGFARVLLPYKFSSSSGSWVEFFKHDTDQQATMVMTYKEINDGQLMEVIAVARSDQYLVDSVFSHWQSLVHRYSTRE